jgi:type IX secretion system PorP/SprF family membrane protein
MKMIRKALSVFTFALSTQGISQDIHFSQYAEIPTSVNPALAGVTYDTRVIVNYKSQWSSIGNKYETMGLSFEQTIKHKKLKNNYFAVFGTIYRDMAGDAKLMTLNPNVGGAYLQRINKRMKLSVGAQTGFYYRTIDISNLQWGEQYDGYKFDPTLATGEPETPRSSITSFDLGTGINFNYVKNDRFLTSKDAVKFDIGASLYHFEMGRSSFIIPSERLLTKYVGYFNGDFNIPGSMNALMPSVMYMRQGGNEEFIAGAMFKFIIGDPSTYTPLKKPRALSIGGYYRFKDAIIPSLLFQYNRYAFGVSYDINVSALTPASNRNGGIEFMLRYNVFPGYGINLGRTDTKPSY